MSEGGTGKGWIAAFTACILLVALATAAVGHAVTPLSSSKKKPKLIFLKARVVSDHVVTPGQLETVALSHLPPRAPLKVFIEPPPTTPECGELYFCDPAPTSPAPGTPPYKASGKGRALLSFVMPSTYFVETDPFKPKEGFVQTFANGQAVHIDVQGISRTRKAKRVGFGFGRAVVQLPPS
jgi:hypothetical protein